MVDIAQTASLSVYRGQSRSGEGEGPGRTVLHGEQYLRVAPELYTTEVLDAIRPWMTLDSDPADHQRLNDQLEGWSLFPAANYLFVVRLVSAGTYDRRAAYFAHGRAWNLEGLPPAFDPGLLLGRADAFDPPWQDPARAGQSTPERAGAWPDQVKAEPETAARFLGHLFQALLDGNNPLIVAAPIHAFASGGALHGLICFSRGGLPAKLRQACRIRIYSRLPELFLRHLGANFIVIPEDTASAAITTRPSATLLDRQGQKIAGRDLDPCALDYANAVIERAIAIPDGLPDFSERFQRRVWQGGLPSAAETRLVQITYNVSFALRGSPERRADLIRNYLPRAAAKLGPGLDWNRLIGDAWTSFPREALFDQLLTDPSELSEASVEFVRAIEDGAARLELRADECLTQWWDADDPGKVRRLVELLAHDPPLLSPAAAAERTTKIPLERLARSGPLHAALQAEAARGLLRRRAHESAELAARAADPRVFDVASRAVSNGQLDPAWARHYVQTARPAMLVEAARRWFQIANFWSSWTDVPRLLLDRLRTLDSGVDDLAPLLDGGFGLDPVENLEIYLRLADLIERVKAPDEPNALMRRVWDALPRLRGSRSDLERLAFDPQWRCLRLQALDLENLLELANGFEQDESFLGLYDEIDARMRRDAERTTPVLARKGWWYSWRRHSALTSRKPEEAALLRRSAFAWLAADVWDGRVEATLEAWKKVSSDLPSSISGEQLARLRDDARGRRPWPWIPPFEQDQLFELIGRAGDLGALAEIAEVMYADETAPSVALDDLVKSSLFANELSPRALGWLFEGGPRERLELETSAYLCGHAGHRADRALEARIESVGSRLEQSPMQALAAAGSPDLWADGRFLYKVADWMNRKRSVDNIGREAIMSIEKHAKGETDQPLRAPSRELVQELVERHYNKAARLLNAEWQEETQKETVADKVIQALLCGRVKDSCWQQLARNIKQAPSERGVRGRHPLSVVAERILEGPRLTPADRDKLARNGWRTYTAAAEENRELMTESCPHTRGLPLFHLAAAMLPPGSLGNAALQIISAAASRGLRQEIPWWRSLLRAIRDYRRYGDVGSADDRAGFALALVFDCLERRGEQAAISEALKIEAINSPEWGLLSEFGTSTP